MKKIILGFIIIIIIILTGCYPTWTSKNYSMDHSEYFETPEEAMEWVYENVQYKYDIWVSDNDYWQTPDQTYEWRTGDCEDSAILFMYFVYEMGYETSLVMTETHAMVLLNGVIYDVNGNQKFDPSEKDLIEEYTYNETIYMADHFHDNVVL